MWIKDTTSLSLRLTNPAPELNVKLHPLLGLWLLDGEHTLDAGGILRFGSLMCLGCGWWVDTAMFSAVMLGSCRSLFTVEVLSLGVDSRSLTWEGKDSNPGGGTATGWVWCCCRWLSWLRTGDGSGWDLKSIKYVKEEGRKVSNNQLFRHTGLEFLLPPWLRKKSCNNLSPNNHRTESPKWGVCDVL